MRVLHHFKILGQGFAQSIADRLLWSVQSQPKICAPSGPAERSKKPCSAEETTSYTDAGARWLYARSLMLKQVTCYQGYLVDDDWRNQRAYLPSKQQINHWTVLTTWNFRSLEHRRSLSPQFQCKGGHIVVEGQRTRLTDWSWKNLYSRDKLLNGYWS